MKKIIILSLLLLCSQAHAQQQPVALCVPKQVPGGVSNCIPVSITNPLPTVSN